MKALLLAALVLLQAAAPPPAPAPCHLLAVPAPATAVLGGAPAHAELLQRIAAPATIYPQIGVSGARSLPL